MRIHGRGDRQSGGRPDGGSRRSARFRSTHRVGQKVKGSFVNWRSAGLAWVEVDGHELLAQLDNAPPAGTTLFFEITQLYPDIVLRHLPAGSDSRGAPLVLINELHQARTALERAIRPAIASLDDPTPEGREAQFLAAVAADPNTNAPWQRTLAAQARTNGLLAERNLGQFEYQPWLLPGATGVMVHVVRSSRTMVRQTVECELPGTGTVRLVRLFGPAGDSHRLQSGPGLDERRALDGLRQVTSQWPDSEYLGKARLSPSAHGGLAAELVLAAMKRS